MRTWTEQTGKLLLTMVRKIQHQQAINFSVSAYANQWRIKNSIRGPNRTFYNFFFKKPQHQIETEKWSTGDTQMMHTNWVKGYVL